MNNNIEEIKEELLNTINGFYEIYTIPPMIISDKEWDTFLYVVESHFMAHNIINDYVHALNIMVRHALYFAQMENAPNFTIKHLIKSLNDLVAFKIYSDEISSMKEEVLELGKKKIK